MTNPSGTASRADGVEILRPADGRYASVLTDDALAFVADLQRRLGPGRERILAARADRWRRLRAGEQPGFLRETADVRNGDWQVAPPAPALARRRVEITGPTEAKMLINAFNSGADVFMVDF
ncbi:MAG TPA: malate synthase A, partial [Acidimicrobiia bacterium]|nr:malate synthase A [Acidimicrobiia bacterium]